MDVIRSRQNTLVKQLKKLVESKRERADSGKIIAEGLHLLQMQVDAGILPELIVVAERCLQDPAVTKMTSLCFESRRVVIANEIFDQIAPADAPSGLLFVSRLPELAHAPDLSLDTLVLDRVQDPGNVGSLIRTAVAAGVRQIVLSSACADPWSPRCLRAGQGAQWLARVYLDVPMRTFLMGYPGQIAATLLDAGISIYAQDLMPATAWLFGNEGQGVDPELTMLATQRVTIPMPGGMESLNVNAAAAVCLFEQVRQRSCASA